MDLHISADSAQFLHEQVATGSFPTTEAAVEAALGMLKRHAALREKLQRGCEQLDRGEYLEFDEEGLETYFRELFDVPSEQNK